MKTILVVDDDEDLLYSYQTLLENDDTLIYVSTSVKKALKILDSFEIDVAILDYMLPEITGDKLGLYINKMHPRIKLYFISGYEEAVDAIKKLDVRVYGFFKKPIEPNLLQDIVDGYDFNQNTEKSDTGPVESLDEYLNIRSYSHNRNY